VKYCQDNRKAFAAAMKKRLSGKEPSVKAQLPSHKCDPIKKGAK
jgi:hypothetical protein